jgi:hypothetical protein
MAAIEIEAQTLDARVRNHLMTGTFAARSHDKTQIRKQYHNVIAPNAGPLQPELFNGFVNSHLEYTGDTTCSVTTLPRSNCGTANLGILARMLHRSTARGANVCSHSFAGPFHQPHSTRSHRGP